MKQLFLKQAYHPRLTVFFAGWGGDENLFRSYCPPDSDFLLCYDYRSLAFDASLLDGYREIRLVAWSMGVWVASQVLSDLQLPLMEKIAINGTATPIDDEKGIPVAIFRGTLEGFSPATLQKFRRRMCGSIEGVKAFLSHVPCRSLEDLREELESIYNTVLAYPAIPFAWDKALIGSRDKIFPLPNQLAAWEGTATEVYDEEHYSEALFRLAFGGLKVDLNG